MEDTLYNRDSRYARGLLNTRFIPCHQDEEMSRSTSLQTGERTKKGKTFGSRKTKVLAWMRKMDSRRLGGRRIEDESRANDSQRSYSFNAYPAQNARAHKSTGNRDAVVHPWVCFSTTALTKQNDLSGKKKDVRMAIVSTKTSEASITQTKAELLGT